MSAEGRVRWEAVSGSLVCATLIKARWVGGGCWWRPGPGWLIPAIRSLKSSSENVASSPPGFCLFTSANVPKRQIQERRIEHFCCSHVRTWFFCWWVMFETNETVSFQTDNQKGNMKNIKDRRAFKQIHCKITKIARKSLPSFAFALC